MKKMINGVETECSLEESAQIQAEWDSNLAEINITKLAKAKEDKKDQLRQEKIDSMLIVEFTEIEAAATETDIKAIKLK